MNERLKKFITTSAEIKKEDYTLVEYDLSSGQNKTLLNLGTEIAIGQSVGNPYVKSSLETHALIKKYAAFIVSDLSDPLNRKSGKVTIAFPLINSNFKEDGINHFLCQIQGGNLDINSFKKCRVKSIFFSNKIKKELFLKKPGIDGIRSFLNNKKKPLAGAIIKPKIGLSPNKMLDVVKKLIDGGADTIKEDEILANPNYCSLKVRSEIITNYLNKISNKVVYLFCINSDPVQTIEKFKLLKKIGANAVHLNYWCGFGIFRNLRKLDKKMFIMYQKSGERIITNKKHNFGISFSALVDIISVLGVDIMHAGMIDGYTDDTLSELKLYSKKLQINKIFPSFSCGLRPEHISKLSKNFTNEYIANSGSYVNSHSGGPKMGIKTIVDAISEVK